MYPPSEKESKFYFVEEDSIFLQNQMSQVRKAVSPVVDQFSDQISELGRFGRYMQSNYESIL